MKNLLFLTIIALVFSFPSCQSVTEDPTKIVESTILWQAKLKPDWTPVKMSELVSDTSRFEKKGSFYKVKTNLKVFGHKAIYLGMVGYNLFPGPNVTLEGSPENIAKYIEENYNLKFKSSKDKTAYEAEVKKYIKLFIQKHPKIKNQSVIIGAYLGP
ncbi:MAG: hypothetical protein GY765_07540 [bacterium]|nr:hypothetical protein [bacterium]